MKNKSALRKLFCPLLLLICCCFAFITVSESLTSHYVTTAVPKLYYTGYNSIGSGISEGFYYYSLDDGVCSLYLLEAKKGQPPAPVLENKILKGISEVFSEKEYNEIVSGISRSLDWNADSLKDIVSPNVFIAFPPFTLKYIIMMGIIAFSLIISLLDIAYIWFSKIAVHHSAG